MVDVFEEVEEQIRSDRYKQLARLWLPILGGIGLLALLAALAWWGWQSWQTGKADAASVAYSEGLDALEAGDVAGAETAFAEAQDEGNGAYRALALNQRAGIAVSAERFDQAVELFDEAARASRDPLISDISALKAAFLVMDTAPLADVEGRLEPLAREGRPFSAYAQEALAMVRLRDGETAEARAALVVLANTLGAPESLRQRAQTTIQSIDDGSIAALAPLARAQAEAAEAAETAAPAGPPPAAPTAPATPAVAPAEASE